MSIEPGGERAEVGTVRAPGGVGERRGGEEPLDGGFGAHESRVRRQAVLSRQTRVHDEVDAPLLAAAVADRPQHAFSLKAGVLGHFLRSLVVHVRP